MMQIENSIKNLIYNKLHKSKKTYSRKKLFLQIWSNN